MTFKDAAQNDIKSVFINLDEFADEHNLNGETVRCVVDKDVTTGYKDTVANPVYGVFVNAITIYVDKNDINPQPVEGALLFLDDEAYTVRNVSVEAGMLVILAEANNQ